jgi:hypothetical protein
METNFELFNFNSWGWTAEGLDGALHSSAAGTKVDGADT